MVFSSLIFVYCFLAIHLLVYFLVKEKYRNYVLLVFSLVFYSWAGPVYLLILIFEAFVSYYLARKIEENKDSARRYFTVELIILLGILIVFKYLMFLAQIVNSVLGLFTGARIPGFTIVLPIGISFYTFQLISYVADVYREKVKANKSFYKVLLYAGLFHQCIAGPIVRYETVCEEIDNRKTDIDSFQRGIWRFSIGLAKKAVLANACAKLVDGIYTSSEALSTQTTGGLWLFAVFYTLQIYLDFSAYSDMAIGMGLMVGFHYLENFNYPYIAKSVKDFWRRWHISLSSFFRDYVYIPLGGSRVKAARHIFNLLVVWALTGLWHGASVNFLLWGLYYFVFLVIENYIFKNKTIPVLGHICTIIIVIVGWTIFRCDTLADLQMVLRGMFTGTEAGIWTLQTTSLLKGNIYLLIVSIIACTPMVNILYKRLCEVTSTFALVVKGIIDVVVPITMLWISTVALIGNSYNPFLYFRF